MKILKICDFLLKFIFNLCKIYFSSLNEVLDF